MLVWSKNSTQTVTLDVRKSGLHVKRTRWKNWKSIPKILLTRLKTLLFVSCHMKDNVFLSRLLDVFSQNLFLKVKKGLGHKGHFLQFCILQQLFTNKGFCLETRLCNIFKTANTITLGPRLF